MTWRNSGASIASMNNIIDIRKLIGISQAELGAAIGVSQGNVSHYEQGRQEVPPDVARRLISAAKERGLVLTFNDVYSQPSTDQATA